MSPRGGKERIQDILAAIAEIEAFLAGMTKDQFLADAKTLRQLTSLVAPLRNLAAQGP